VEQVALVVPAVPVVLAAQVLDSSVPLVVPVAVSVPVALVELAQALVLVPPRVPVLVLTVHPQVAVAAVAVVPAVEPLVRSVVAAESPRHVSRSGQREQNSNSARHRHLVA
jgi:hypothetical protein